MNEASRRRREPDELDLAVSAALARFVDGDKVAGQEFWALLFRFRDGLLRRFPGKSRQRWFAPEDAFSEAILATYEEALRGEIDPPEDGLWHGFLHERVRKKLWKAKRRDAKCLTANAGAAAMAPVETDKKGDNPVEAPETRDELDSVVPKVKEVLSPKQQAAFFGKAQDLTHEEIGRAARTTPGAARVHGDRAEKKMKKLRRDLKKNRVA